jgi:hypothetical protein
VALFAAAGNSGEVVAQEDAARSGPEDVEAKVLREAVLTLREHELGVKGVACSPDGRCSASAGQDTLINPLALDGICEQCEDELRVCGEGVDAANEGSVETSRPKAFHSGPGLLLVCERENKQGEAAATIRKLGGKVMIDERKSGKPIVGVDLSDTRVTDADLACLKDCPDLVSLRLAVTNITGAGFEHLKELKKLEWLVAERTKITDQSLAHLKGIPSLRLLDLSCTTVTDAGVAHLKALSNLVSLNLSMTRVSDAGVAHLKELKQLEELGLSFNNQISDACLGHLQGMSGLKELDLSSTKVTAGGVKALRAALPKTNIMENAR